MERITYPLLYFDIAPQVVLGFLVGTDLQVVEKDLERVKLNLGNYLQRQYKKYDDYPFVDLIDPKLRIMDFEVRPTYRDDGGSYPLSQAVKVPVAIIYGATEQDNYACHVPSLNGSFYYYEPKQFESLVQYFVTNALNQLDPPAVYKLLRYRKPKLDKVILKVNADRDFFRFGRVRPRDYPTLKRLTEPYPFPRNKRKQQSHLPEAAWELEMAVADVLDKLINTRSNVLLVGKHGVGKSAVLQQAIRKITTQSRKQQLDFTFWRIMSQRITASAKYLGEWQEQVESLVDELQSANGILWVADLIQLLQTGGEGAEDSVAAFLLPFLQTHKMQMIGEATPEQLESMRRLLPGFVQTFQIIRIDELSEDKIRSVLTQFAQYVQTRLQITLSQEAIDQSYRLLLRYYPYESFPGKGIKFLSRCVNKAQLANRSKIERADVIQEFVYQTGLPELFLRDDLLLNTRDLENYFHERIIGQSEAIARLIEIVKIYKAGINNPYKPIATLLFAGPTGVGKTASAKALADYFFGQGQKKSPLIRIDMSEFQHPGQMGRLIGSGKEVGQLIKEVRERPFAVILLDEIEKAARPIFDALLTLLDEGLLIDNFGRQTDFRNTIIIMTSNLGASVRSSIGYQETSTESSAYLSAIRKHFRPEFINRIDSVVFFNAIDSDDLRKITLKELKALTAREGFAKRQLQLLFDDSLVDHLVNIGFDKRYGARPLQRAIEQTIVKPMSYWLLENGQKQKVRLKLSWEGKLVISMK
ncbi:AAA family ATPase [Flavilitoribacter nigricans]|uniref:Molecular chaperone n=1 Tax=Flavilitoribacter nigricans (strain ATCC 23147 / DSM 23189 / NBRC 102662 / NCIMB 1420 / SS-2) TaxID=1122177 RepID=A0A2D0NG49_FLAN2|nr:AAA family ATPase [Flavilitoribacter nigricans]PHN07471.1 molecular chaperone [Flavilitoribacter nigricans DSM 23189 = NBRC 102662]